MLISQKQAQEIRDQLKDDKNLICCPSPEMGLELEMVHDIPHDRIRVLMCLKYKGDIAVMSKRQYSYYERKERDILSGKHSYTGKQRTT